MPKTLSMTPTAALNDETTLVIVVDTSKSSWVIGAQVPGFPQTKAKQKIAASAPALEAAMDSDKRRAAGAGKTVERVVVVYEAGYGGFWLARWLQQRGVEAYVIHPASVPVDRKTRRAKSDAIDVDLLLRTVLAWLRGEPRVCSMVPVPDEYDEDARRPVRERDDLIAERIALTHRIGGILLTLGIESDNPLWRDWRTQLAALQTPLGTALPAQAHAQIDRLLARLELVLEQIATLERERDAAMTAGSQDPAAAMIALLASLQGLGPQLATLLVRECFVRDFVNAKALGSYAGLTGTPYNSGSSQREQGMSRAGNPRLRRAMVELAWLWQRYQPGSALAKWLQERLGGSKGRMRKVLTVALARKLLIALWRFVKDGLLPEGAQLKSA
jgi:transposase